MSYVLPSLKTELQKAFDGEEYDCKGPEIQDLRIIADRLCRKMNGLTPENHAEKNVIAKELFGSIGKNATILPNFFCEIGTQIFIGDNFFSNFNLVIVGLGKLTIGNNCSLGPNVLITTANHKLDPSDRNICYCKPIVLGNDVWVGGNVSILPGITINDGAVVGAGSVVTKDVPANTVVAGNPAKFIKNT